MIFHVKIKHMVIVMVEIVYNKDTAIQLAITTVITRESIHGYRCEFFTLNW